MVAPDAWADCPELYFLGTAPADRSAPQGAGSVAASTVGVASMSDPDCSVPDMMLCIEFWLSVRMPVNHAKLLLLKVRVYWSTCAS